MNVAALKKCIAELPDDTQVLVCSSDHRYRPADCDATTALCVGKPDDKRRAIWNEDYGELLTPEGEMLGKRVKVLVVA